MRLHYSKKYGYNKDNYFIMPCYNQEFEGQINDSKYDNMDFVYAGSLSKWQCVDKTLSIFNRIKKRWPKASLTILTNEQEEAKRLLKRHNLINEKISYIAKEILQEELKKVK